MDKANSITQFADAYPYTHAQKPRYIEYFVLSEYSQYNEDFNSEVFLNGMILEYVQDTSGLAQPFEEESMEYYEDEELNIEYTNLRARIEWMKGNKRLPEEIRAIFEELHSYLFQSNYRINGFYNNVNSLLERANSLRTHLLDVDPEWSNAKNYYEAQNADLLIHFHQFLKDNNILIS